MKYLKSHLTKEEKIMQSKYETEKANETVNNLVNGERIMLATEVNTVKFTEKEIIAIQEFNEELKHLIKAYEPFVGEIDHEFSIENENLVKTNVRGIISQVFLRENQDKNQREFLTKISREAGYDSGYPDVVYGEIKESLDAVIVAYDQLLEEFFGIITIRERCEIEKFNPTDQEYIDEFLGQLTWYIKPYKVISINSGSRYIHERKLDLELEQNYNQLSVKNLQLSIDITLTADKTTFACDKVYTVKYRITGLDNFYDDYKLEILCYHNIEEALKQMFSLLKTHLNKVLEVPTYFVKKVEDDESVNNDF